MIDSIVSHWKKNTFASMYLSVSMCCVYCIPCQENTYGTWLDENEDSFVHFVALQGFYMIVFITAFEFVNFPLIILNCDLSPFERYYFYCFLKIYPLITSPKRKKLKKLSLVDQKIQSRNPFLLWQNWSKFHFFTILLLIQNEPNSRT